MNLQHYTCQLGQAFYNRATCSHRLVCFEIGLGPCASLLSWGGGHWWHLRLAYLPQILCFVLGKLNQMCWGAGRNRAEIVCVVYLGVKEAGRNRETECQMQSSSTSSATPPSRRQVRALGNHGDHFSPKAPFLLIRNLSPTMSMPYLAWHSFFL